MTRVPRVIVCSHLGRPKGAPDPKYTLAPVAARLGELLGAPVIAATDTVGESAQAAVAALSGGQVLLLENLRFNAGETSKDDAERGAFADQLAAFADAYVDDAFGAVHRKHASVYDVPARLPHVAGGLVVREVEVLRRVSDSPETAVRGGPRRFQGLRQARRHQGAAAEGRPVARRWRHVLHLPQGPGPRGRQVAARGGHGRHLPGAARRRPQGRIVLPVDVVAATAFAADARA